MPGIARTHNLAPTAETSGPHSGPFAAAGKGLGADPLK